MTQGEQHDAPLVPGAVNFRDVGGLRAGTGADALRRPLPLGQSRPAGRRRASRRSAALGIRRIIDLRADDEVSYAPSRVDGLAAVTQRVPLFLGSVASFFADDIGLDEMYRRLVADSSAGVVEVVRGILADQPVLVHCTVGQGSHRVTVALALAAAGVDEDEVVADYARTEGLLPAVAQPRIVEHAAVAASGRRAPRGSRDALARTGDAGAAARRPRRLRLARRTICARTG